MESIFDSKTILKALGEQVVETIQSKLTSDMNIYNEIEYEIVDNTVNILAPDYFVFIDKGRKPNSKMPPYKPIADWVKRKNIETTAIFAIRKSIGIKGIPAKNITEDIIALNELFAEQLEIWGLKRFEDYLST